MEAVIDEAPLLVRHRLTIDEYMRMGEVGLLSPQARVELIEGEVIDMPPIGSRHMAAVKRLTVLLIHAVGNRATVSVQDPVGLDKWSEPEPDLALLLPRSDFYAGKRPAAADVLLLIEVADSSARYDREIKLPLYARHGIGEVWIVDLDARMVRFFRDPRVDADGARYADITATETPGVTPIGTLPGVAIDLAGVLS